MLRHPLQPLADFLAKVEPENSPQARFLAREVVGNQLGKHDLGETVTALLSAALALVQARRGLPARERKELAGWIPRAAELAREHYAERREEQRAEEATAAPAPEARNLNEMDIADVLVQLGFLDAEERELVRARAREESRTEEQALLDLGLATPENLERARDLQRMLGLAQPPNRSFVMPARPMLLGEILVACGRLERADLQAALEVQRTQGGLLGNVLVDLAAVSWDDVAHALREQGKLASRI